jgi:hypothetical protein
MKARLSVLCLLALPALVAGCSEDAIAPDTTPPLAPVLQGATFELGVVGVWWAPNTEPDLAGYNVYVQQNGQTWTANQQIVTDNYVAITIGNPEDPVTVFVTALDVSSNESSPSATRRALEPIPQPGERQAQDQPWESAAE